MAPFIQVRGFPGDQRRSGCLNLQERGAFGSRGFDIFVRRIETLLLFKLKEH